MIALSGYPFTKDGSFTLMPALLRLGRGCSKAYTYQLGQLRTMLYICTLPLIKSQSTLCNTSDAVS